MNQYCFAIDSGDFATFQKLFEKASWVAEGKTPGPEAAGNVILYSDGTPRTKHATSNVVIDVDESANAASAHSYVVVYQATEGFPLQAIYAGDYIDTFVRENGEWRFAVREIRHSLIGDMSRHLRQPSLTIPGALPIIVDSLVSRSGCGLRHPSKKTSRG